MGYSGAAGTVVDWSTIYKSGQVLQTFGVVEVPIAGLAPSHREWRVRSVERIGQEDGNGRRTLYWRRKLNGRMENTSRSMSIEYRGRMVGWCEN